MEQFGRHCYFDRRDPRPILQAIFNQPAFRQLRDGRLHVYPKPMSTPRYEQAAKLLYDIINDSPGVTTDAYGFPIYINTGTDRDLIRW